MASVSEKRFPLDAKEYELYEEIGDGVSATVYKARCVPLNEVVAIKVLDLEKCNNDLDGIRREVQTMSLINHQNLLRAHCSFTAGHNLWVVMSFMAEGSFLHIMKSAFPDGFEEPVIATLLCEVLKALVYLHAHGQLDSLTNFSIEIPSASSKERELQSQLIQLQKSVGNLVEELQRQKVKNALLEKKLNFFIRKEEKVRE